MNNYLAGPDKNEQYTNLVPFDKGGMGEIYLADDTVNNEKVAIKIIDLPQKEYAEMLMRELDVSLSLSGDNIVSTLFAGKKSFASHDQIYIVQKFYNSGNLRNKIIKNIPLNECFSMMLDILNGAIVVHKKIVHRDLKPENILVDNDGNLHIADFGLAKYIEEETRTRTFKGSGTYPYMAPECWTNQENTVAMDIYALGIIFYEILAGGLPDRFSNPDDWRDYHLFSQLPDIVGFRTDVPVKLKQIISKMTEKRISDRFESVSEVSERIREAMSQSMTEQSEFSNLANLAHSTNQLLSSKKLEQKRIEEEKEKLEKTLNFHVEELFSDIKRIVNGINSQLEGVEIQLTNSRFTGVIESRKLELKFNNKSIYIQFYPSSTFPSYERDRAVNIRNIQGSRRDIFFQPPGASIFEQKNFILLGNVHCNHQNPNLHACYGFNPILVKAKEEQYGKWYRAQFKDSSLGHQLNRKDFSLRDADFLQEFENCFAMHTLDVDYQELKDADLTRAIQEILTP
ncbi:hypothetical protein DO021_10315 [Desulfobacter hydrogenophilus]|uniref:Serine/threonine protein kinase n=1 Tax=Desulfobacter hydrogenophilus TaxID=2291 RepID=A0A328FBR0_9BACT|nr:serine/threonine-protein kinase [Desulfobacter hydrogenophilus]NDY71918.1 serine/threonine protein kinase [Desulfobacter hydrogenophilus]QBH12389.1 serine/threonine protein kinase [Desulfobacter hydrogenophilus]RAM02008.1 hypothetical protein DO021_10315 [Desulfobacter hydrogenophilus]